MYVIIEVGTFQMWSITIVGFPSGDGERRKGGRIVKEYEEQNKKNEREESGRFLSWHGLDGGEASVRELFGAVYASNSICWGITGLGLLVICLVQP